AQDFWQEQADEPEVRIDGRIQPEAEDAYWQGAYWAQPYARAELGYDDYAPAYCVGYIGFAQYGGRFEDAEKSLCANWIRIKGDSRLELDEAMQAIRAAWEHAADAQSATDEEIEELVDANLLAAHARQQQPAYAAA
ncbi:MAG TPA: hypothetical protein VNB23_00385, partial [Ramlibacter sp.]|nr:hypothetical protein [Ramlibacter sp.]